VVGRASTVRATQGLGMKLMGFAPEHLISEKLGSGLTLLPLALATLKGK